MALTLTDAVLPPCGAVAEAGDTVNAQLTPLWLTVTVWPACARPVSSNIASNYFRFFAAKRRQLPARRKNTIPPAISASAAQRFGPNGSLNRTAPRIAANSTDVSRSEATRPMGARVIAQVAME